MSEFILPTQENLRETTTRRGLFRRAKNTAVAASGLVIASHIPNLGPLSAETAEAQDWIYADYQRYGEPWTFRCWFPTSQRVANRSDQSTMYEPEGPLDVYEEAYKIYYRGDVSGVKDEFYNRYVVRGLGARIEEHPEEENSHGQCSNLGLAGMELDRGPQGRRWVQLRPDGAGVYINDTQRVGLLVAKAIAIPSIDAVNRNTRMPNGESALALRFTQFQRTRRPFLGEVDENGQYFKVVHAVSRDGSRALLKNFDGQMQSTPISAIKSAQSGINIYEQSQITPRAEAESRRLALRYFDVELADILIYG